jgi:hypothetical protein
MVARRLSRGEPIHEAEDEEDNLDNEFVTTGVSE